MKKYIVWVVSFILCLFVGVIAFFASLFVKFLYVQDQIFGVVVFFGFVFLLTHLIYHVVSAKEHIENGDKNEP